MLAKSEKGRSMIRKSLTSEELEKLKTALRKLNTTESVVIELMMVTGARQREVLFLTRQNYDATTNTLLIKALKGSKDRRIKLPDATESRAAKLFERVETTVGALLSDAVKAQDQTRQIRRCFERICKEVLGNVVVTLHGLRHTFAMECLKALDKDVVAVQTLMGHSALNSTGRYLQELESIENMKKVSKVFA